MADSHTDRWIKILGKKEKRQQHTNKERFPPPGYSPHIEPSLQKQKTMCISSAARALSTHVTRLSEANLQKCEASANSPRVQRASVGGCCQRRSCFAAGAAAPLLARAAPCVSGTGSLLPSRRVFCPDVNPVATSVSHLLLQSLQGFELQAGQPDLNVSGNVRDQEAQEELEGQQYVLTSQEREKHIRAHQSGGTNTANKLHIT